MQALSQVSYTPTSLAVIADSFISIAAFSLFVKHFFEFFLSIPFLPFRGFQPILQNGPLCSCAALARQTCVFRCPAPPGHSKRNKKNPDPFKDPDSNMVEDGGLEPSTSAM